MSQADAQTTINDLKEIVKKFTEARLWTQFHSPKTLTQAVSIEASELMELFLWANNEDSKLILEQKRAEVESEMADVFWYLLQLSWQYDIDLSDALKNKMVINEKKYPVEKAKGNSLKYTVLAQKDG